MGRKARLGLFLSLVLSVAMLAGCWNRKEVNQIIFASAAGIEKKGNQVKLTVQYLRPSKKDQVKVKAEALTLTTQGETLFEGLRLMNTRLSRKGFWSHASAIVLSEEIAKEGILSHLSFFRRDHELRGDLVIFVADKPEQLLRSAPNIEAVLAQELKDTAKGGMKFEGISLFSTIHEVSKMLYSSSPYAVLTHVTLNEKTGKFRLDGLSFFRKDRMVGTFKGKDAAGWNWITGNITSTIIPLPCEKRKKKPTANLSVEIIKATSKLEVVEENDNLTLKVKIKAKSNVGENGCNVDLKKEEEFIKLGKLASEEIKELIERMLDYAQNTIKTDIFGFGSAYYQKHPRKWKKISRDWNEHFSKAKREVKVDVEVVGSGLIFSEKIGE